ncbi:DUF1003 domain-containing protein [Clostridium saccharobutylicum]|uniref:DUF1003 domain-containing protein n=1 Tax=Clostridium saccharobutylicum TaxID=169679 RepID=A0A1S8MYX7_CLOSA|nr:DUF1003 domain-containing protein [Clostridium saccharobutylicum]OOM09397.1 hypothetical protein CLOSAC_36780 [Clostridium saccharobutylicum]
MNNDDKVSYSKEELVRQILQKDKDLKGSNINEELMHELISGKISKNINEADDENSTLGQRVADKMATFGGSWTFIISFCIVLTIWIIGNAFVLSNKAFDPYPFVFLNLVLSCLAAIQAPIIMMSQNRQSEKDRLTASNDYLINLKSEIIVEDLHYKIDTLMEQQEENTKNIKTLLNTIEELKKNID